MRRSFVLAQISCSLFVIACTTKSIETSSNALMPNENILFWSNCTTPGAIASKWWGCYAAGPLTKTVPHACPNIKDFCQQPTAQAIMNDCKQKGKIFAVWAEIEMGSNAGITQEGIEKWMTLTKDTINYMKTSGEFSNETLEASEAKMND